MKKNTFLSIFLVSMFLFSSFSASGFKYQSNIEYTFNTPVNINTYDYTGTRLTVSFLQGSSVTILDIMNNSKQSFSIQIPNNSFYQINSLKVAHISDSAFLITYAGYDNGNKVMKSFKYANNVASNISQSFQVNDYLNYDLFSFKSNIYLYLMNNTFLSIYMYNETSNAWIDGFAYDISNWSLHDFGSTSDTIIFGFKNDLTSQDAKIVVFDFNTTFRVKNEYFLQSYAPSIAPLNNSFLVINDTSLVEINTKTNVTNVLSNNSDSIPYYYPAKIRAFSNQEVLIQTGNTIRAYLIVNNLLSLAWSILISDTYLFEIFQSTRELMLFIQHYNYQSGNPYSGYLILSSGMTDPTYDFYSLGISDNSPSASTYYSYFSSSSSGDNFGPGFLFGIVFTGLLAGVWYGYSRSHSRRKILRNGVSSHSSTQFNIAPNKVICINCRNKLEEGSVYCSYCGQNQIESKSI